MKTRPPSTSPKPHLREAFDQDEIKQGERLDDLAKELLKLELGIPGLYLAAMKIANASAANQPGFCGMLPFLFWVGALILTLNSLLPKRRKVQPDLVSRTENTPEEVWSLEEYFQKTAARKFYSCASAALVLMIGTGFAFWTLIAA